MDGLLSVHYFQNWTQIVSIFIVSLTLLNEGLLICWPSSAILILTNPDHPLKLTKDQTSYFTVIPCIGLIIGALPAGYLANKIGRKKTLILCTIPYFISGLLLGISQSIWTFYAARLLHGLASSCSLGASPLYCGEISLPKVRGKWGNLLMINTYAGVLLSYVVGSYFNLLEMSYFFMGVPIITLLFFLGVPESPYYLIMKKNYKEAKISLEWLRQRDDVEEELSRITVAVERQMASPSTYQDIFLNKCNRRALVAALMSRFAQQFSGTFALLMYAHVIFTMAGGSFWATTSTVVCGTIQLVFIIIGTMVNHKFGRRSTIFTSSSVCISLLILMAIYFYLYNFKIVDLSNWTWFPFVGLIGNLSAYAMGLSFIPTMLGAELFSSSVKERAIGITNMWYGVLIASSSKIFQVLVQYGLQVPFIFFAISCFILTVICYFVVPETKGKTLEEIQLALNGRKKTVNDELFPEQIEDRQLLQIHTSKIHKQADIEL